MKLTYQFVRKVGNTNNVFIRRFYKNVAIRPAADAITPFYKYSILLDGKQLRTPGKNPLHVPNYDLAVALAAEFHAQDQILVPAAMPILSIVRTAIDCDTDPNLRDNFLGGCLQFLQGDTVCFREEPETKLGKIQNQLLEPVREYANKRLSINVQPHYGFGDLNLSADDNARVQNFLNQFDNWRLTSLVFGATNLKSTLLAITLMDSKIGVRQAVDFSRIEENFQIEQYGEVEGHHDVDQNSILLMTSASKFVFDCVTAHKGQTLLVHCRSCNFISLDRL
eukprot:TRINITY_DN12353_c0_g1_i6.p1 TRINITY_DN12353_c0_g1~~TRINITY_DN12353_c0_g1_i6.p1  ORF type:complete len:280 (-),score=32.04 TRINITY_DN12353_c0_g1_i6:220-1059(-)